MKITKSILIFLTTIVSIFMLTSCPGAGSNDSSDDAIKPTESSHSLSVYISEQAQVVDLDEVLKLNAVVTDSSEHTVVLSWFINNVEQSGENSESFNFSSSTEGSYTIKVAVACEAATSYDEVIIIVEQVLNFSETARYTAGIELDPVPASGSYKSVSVDGNIILLGTLNDGVKYSINSGSSWNTLNNTDNSLSDEHVYCAAIDPSDSDIWYFGTFRGLSVYDYGSTSMLTYYDNDNVKVNDIIISSNALYMATDSGVYYAANKNDPATVNATTNGLPSNNVVKLAMAGSTIYAATDSGLASASTGTPPSWTTNNAVNGPDGNDVQDVFAVSGKLVCWSASYVHISTDEGSSWTAELQPAGGVVKGSVVLGDYLYTVRYGSHLWAADFTKSDWYDQEITLPDPPSLFGYNNNGICMSGGSLYIVHNDGLLVGTID